MVSSCFRSFAGVVVASALLSPNEARAYLFTWGESISHIGDSSVKTPQNPGVTKVGYKFSYFGVFWLDLWTSGGTYCVYEGNHYNAIQPAEAAHLLGKK